MSMNVTEDLPLASNDIDVQLLEAAKSGDLETVKVSITFIHAFILKLFIAATKLMKRCFVGVIIHLFTYLFNGQFAEEPE